MPTIALDQITIGGPCKIVDPNTTIYTEGDVVLEPSPTWRDIESAVLPGQDKVNIDNFWTAKFTAKSVWTAAYREFVLPAAFYNYAVGGARMIGAANRLVHIYGADGVGYDLTRAIVTELAPLYYGLGESVYGESTITAFIGHGKALTDADAFLTPNALAWDQTDYPTTHQEAMATLAWGAVAGWTPAVFAEKGFKHTHELKKEPVRQGGVLVDYRVQSYRGMLSFLPQKPTSAQLLSAASAIQTIGARQSSNANNAVISASGLTATLYSTALEKLSYHFDNKLNRHGEIQLVTAMTGASTTRLAFA